MSASTSQALKVLNYTVGGIQLVLCAFLVIWYYTIDTEAAAMLTFRIGEYNRPWSEGRDHGTLPVSALIALLAVFTMITGLVHILAYGRSPGGWYQRSVDQGQNWVRWIEYAITATIMVVVIAITCGTNSTDVLILMGVSTLCCMLCGYLSEATATTHFRVSAVATLVGWMLLIAVFSLVVRRFASIYRQSQEDGRDGRDGPPAWVWVILICLTLLFGVFGFIHLVHMRKQWKSRASITFNRRIETSYTIASIVSKTLLVSMMGYGLFARTRDPKPSSTLGSE
jgi:hypothetical protein